MTPEQAFEAIGRGFAQALLQSKPVASPKRSTARRSGGSTSVPATTEVPPPIQSSMFEPPNAGMPDIKELDKMLGISRPDDGTDPPGTYRPGETETPPWIAR